MEIDITHLFDADVSEFSASVMERGQNAGPETWANAKAEGADHPLLTSPEALDKARDYFREFGAWDDEERAAWDADEVNALLIQYISGNIREIEALCMRANGTINWRKVERLSSEGTIAGDIYPHNGRIYFTMNH